MHCSSETRGADVATSADHSIACKLRDLTTVMPGLVPGIHVFRAASKTWMAGTSPAMTNESSASVETAQTNGQRGAFRFPGSSRPLNPRSQSPRRLSPCPLAAAGLQLDRAVRDGQAEGRADRALDQADLAAMGAHQLGRDGEAKPGAAGAGRALERLEQMRARRLGNARAGVRHLDLDHGALAPSGDADLVGAGVARVAALERLQRVAREIEQHAEQLVGVGVGEEAAL